MNTEVALYRLMTWLSPSYPLGAYSYSHGLEFAVEAGFVSNRVSLRNWVTSAVTVGAGRSDGALLAAAWRAAADADHASLDAAVELAGAWRGTAETALESRAQGAAFLATTRASWPHPGLDELALKQGGDIALPVAVGAAAALHDVPLAAVITAFLHSFAANLVSAGLRLIPLGQTDGQLVIADLEPVILAASESVLATPLDQIGTATPMLDWCSMRHETQYTRLFRS